MNDINTTGTTYPKPWEYCSYRLPCGLCQRTNTVCPYYAQNISVTYEAGRGDIPYVTNQCEVTT